MRNALILAIVTILCALGLGYSAEAAPVAASAITTPDADKLLAMWGLIAASLTALGAVLGGIAKLVGIWAPAWGPLVWIEKLSGWASAIGTKTPLTPKGQP